MLRMCVYMHSHFLENHPIRILEDGPLISEVVLSHLNSPCNTEAFGLGPIAPRLTVAAPLREAEARWACSVRPCVVPVGRL
jgi:hypothetical protein